MLLNLLRLFFDNHGYHSRSHHEGYAGGVKTHENGQFLYKSNGGDYLLKSRLMDYVLLFAGMGWITGYSQLLLVPFIVGTLSYPRKLAVLNYFTFHAELLPHTE